VVVEVRVKAKVSKEEGRPELAAADESKGLFRKSVG
jgi:hypothetical protein